MSEVAPGVTALAIVLANRAPLAVAEVGAHRRHGTPRSSASSKRRTSLASFIVVTYLAPYPAIRRPDASRAPKRSNR